MDREKGIGFGVFLLSIGVIVLLFNLGIISWSIFSALFYLWPLILVVIGVNIIFRRNWIVKLVTWLLFLAVVIGYSYYSPDFKGKSNQLSTENPVSIEKPANIQKAALRVSMGACSINVGSGTDKLLEATVKDKYVEYSSDADTNSTAPTLVFKRKQAVNINEGNNTKNSFRLNKDIPWDVKVETGASDCVLDFSEIKIDKLEYDGGASNFKAIFSDKNSLTEIKIDAGVSDISLTIPETGGIKVRTDKGLSSTNFGGQGWIKNNNVYQTPNYDQAACKFDIDANIGLSNFNIKRSK